MKTTHILLTSILMGSAAAFLSAEVLVGWNVFEPVSPAQNTNIKIDDSTPDTVAEGFSGIAGVMVLESAATQGGGKESLAENDFSVEGVRNNTYGFSYVMAEGELGEASGAVLSTFGSSLHLDIKVTNNSGVDVTIDYIHLDFRLNFASLSGAPGQGAITVSHLSGASDLQDGFTGRKLYDSGPIQGGTAEDNADYSWKQVDVSTEAMTNVTLAPGESAAFRISAAKVGDFNNGFRVDNVAISTGPLPEVVDTWAGYEKRPDGYVDTTPFLGWIWVSDVNDYVWSVNLGKYIYLPEGFVSDSGTWTYISQ